MREAKGFIARINWVVVALILISAQILPIIVQNTAVAASVPSNPGCTAATLQPCITADKDDYAPTDTVNITGYGFVSGLSYLVSIDSDKGDYSFSDSVVADSLGVIALAHMLDGTYRPNYTSTVKDQSGNVVATTNFTDSRIINSATVNGGSSTTVAPGASVNAVVNVSTNGSNSNDDWQCTSWQINPAGGSGEDDNVNISNDATTNHNFAISAPTTAGSYDVVFTAYSDDNCNSGASAPKTLTNAIIVEDVITITGVTLNGSAATNVDPADEVTIGVTADVDAGIQWRSTSWQIDGGGWTCVNSSDKTGAGTFSISFPVTAPVVLGAHSVAVRAHTNSSCSEGTTTAFSLANSLNVAIVANPALGSSCGLDIALVIDSSGSIDSTELAQMKTAYVAFLNAFLPATSTQFSVTDFDETASVVQGFTNNLATLTTAVNSPSSGGTTNWEDGLTKAQSTFAPDPRPAKPNLVIFASDGNPNTVIGGSASEAVSVNKAVQVANNLKTNGTRVMSLGIGGGLNIDNLKAISGPSLNSGISSDVITSDFSTLATDLANLAKTLCGGTITAQKMIDADGNLQTADLTPASGWTFGVSGSPSPAASGATDVDGYTESFNVENGTYTVTETVQPGYEVLSASCKDQNDNTLGAKSGDTVAGIEITTDQIVKCTFVNRLKPATLTLKKIAINDNGGTLLSNSFNLFANLGLLTGGTTETDGYKTTTTYLVPNVIMGANTVSEESKFGYLPSDWDCGGATTLANGSTVTVNPGDNVTCTVTNNDVAPVLTLIKQLVGNYKAGASIDDWNLTATDGNYAKVLDGTSGVNGNVNAGSYTLGETSIDDKYAPWQYSSSWECDGGTLLDSVLAISLGQKVECTVSNELKPAKLIVNKVVVNDNGGIAKASDFSFKITGDATSYNFANGAGTTVEGSKSFDLNAGEYSATENSFGGYAITSNTCADVVIANGEEKECTVTNDDEGGTIIVSKEVINDDEGMSTAKDFGAILNGGEPVAFVEGGNPLLGEVTFKVPAGWHSISEDGEDENGYFTSYENDCEEEQDLLDRITSYSEGDNYEQEPWCFPGDCLEMYVAVGQTVRCYIENDDEGEGDGPNVDLTVDKDDGGAVVQPGGSYAYTINVYNNTFFTTAKDVVVTDAIPANLKVTSITDGAWTCNVTGQDTNGYGGLLTCTLPSLNGFTYADIITVNVTVKAGTAGTITNTACVESSRGETNTDNNCSTAETPTKSIKVVKSGPASAKANDAVTYTFTVTNTGAAPLSSITVADNIAGNGVYQSGDTNGNNILETTETWVYTAKYIVPTNAGNQVVNTVKACGTVSILQIEDDYELSFYRQAAVATPTPVCDDDSHTLTVTEPAVLVDTGSPALLATIVGVFMLIGIAYSVAPARVTTRSSKK